MRWRVSDVHSELSPSSPLTETGIHGMPTTTWDEVGKRFGDNFYGYCAHGVLIFPTWHRPYLSLVEASVVKLEIGA